MTLLVKKIDLPSDIPAAVRKKLDALSPDLPRPPFRMILAGPSNSGKTNLLINMLTDKAFYKNFWKPENIFLFSPTVKLDKKLQLINTVNVYDDWDDTVIQEIVDQQKYILSRPKRYDAENRKKKMPHCLIVLDDLIETGAFKRNSSLNKLIFRARHYNISLIITSQKLSSITRLIRLNSDYIIFFEPNNGSEYDFFLSEFASKSTRVACEKKLLEIFKTPYQFLCINFNGKNAATRYRVNFSNEFLESSRFVGEAELA